MTSERDKAFEKWWENNEDRELVPADNVSIGYLEDRSAWLAGAEWAAAQSTPSFECRACERVPRGTGCALSVINDGSLPHQCPWGPDYTGREPCDWKAVATPTTNTNSLSAVRGGDYRGGVVLRRCPSCGQMMKCLRVDKAIIACRMCGYREAL